jgi:phosphoesterase RecJ-like protein
MASYRTNTTWREIAERVRAARRIALVTHSRPDGDGVGSVLALARAFDAPDRPAHVFLMGPIEPCLGRAMEPTGFRRVEADPPGDDYDLIFVVDTGAWSQVEPLEAWLRRHHDAVVGIDHHAHGEDVAARRIVDPTAAATAQLVADLLDEMGCPLTGGTEGIAEPIYLGLATDTGWFRYANAGPAAFRLAARLLEAGVDKSRLYELIEESHRPQRLALEARSLGSLQYVNGGAVAIQAISRRDFEETGATIDDLTGIVNLPMVVEPVRVSILLSQTEPGVTKVSFRSKPVTAETPALDVNRLARQFGGGGHVFAAGARLPVALDEARRRVLAAVERAQIASPPA